MIKRIFGVMKKRFKVLTIPQEYDLKTQAQIVCALGAVHNFMKLHDPDDPLFKDKTIGSESEEDDTMTTQHAVSEAEGKRATARRERIALTMWKDYKSKKNRT